MFVIVLVSVSWLVLFVHSCVSDESRSWVLANGLRNMSFGWLMKRRPIREQESWVGCRVIVSIFVYTRCIESQSSSSLGVLYYSFYHPSLCILDSLFMSSQTHLYIGIWGLLHNFTFISPYLAPQWRRETLLCRVSIWHHNEAFWDVLDSRQSLANSSECCCKKKHLKSKKCEIDNIPENHLHCAINTSLLTVSVQ